MKKKRNLTLLVVLFAMVALGIGYAAATQDLTINGKAAGEAKDFVVKFTRNTKVDDTTNTTIGTITDSVASFTADLKKDNYRVAIFEIINESTELEALVTLKTKTIGDHFTAAVTYYTGDNESAITDLTPIVGDVVIPKNGGKIWAEVKIGRNDSNPIVDTITIDKAEDVQVVLTATAQAPSVN